MNFEEETNKDFGPNKQRRSRFELWSEVLDVCLWNGRTQSWLIWKVGVNTRTIKEVLDFLQARKLIEKKQEENNGGDLYFTTESGKEALKQFYLLVSKFFAKDKS